MKSLVAGFGLSALALATAACVSLTDLEEERVRAGSGRFVVFFDREGTAQLQLSPVDDVAQPWNCVGMVRDLKSNNPFPEYSFAMCSEASYAIALTWKFTMNRPGSRYSLDVRTADESSCTKLMNQVAGNGAWILAPCQADHRP